jgi:NADH dehydrogenase
MRILVTCGTGVVGRSTVTALIQRGHVVNLLSRRARRDAEQWPQGVHPFAGNVADAGTIGPAIEGCEAVLHLTAIVDESGHNTFERINVEGTRNVLAAADRAGVKRFVYVSSLGADHGQSAYHQSKRKAEAIVRTFNGEWIVVRPGNVFGPGDEQISLLLRMIRTLPALPVIGDGDQPFQPIWHEDLGELLSRVVERDDLHGKELDVAGGELTSQNDLVDRLSKITGRDVPRIAVPELIANVGMRLASAVGIGVAFNDSQIRMLTEGNQIAPGRENALFTQLAMTPTPLDEALKRLAEDQQEQLPDDDGVGPLRRKRSWVDIAGSPLTPEELMLRVRQRFGDLMASFIDARAEPGATTIVEEDATLTLSLPLRGHIQVRVAEVEPRVFTLVTLAGHPLSGAVRFLSEARGQNLRFEIQVFDRAANVIDLVLMRTLGERMQDASWREMVENVARDCGGTVIGVRQETETLDEDQADRIEEWLRDIVMERKREEAGI